MHGTQRCPESPLSGYSPPEFLTCLAVGPSDRTPGSGGWMLGPFQTWPLRKVGYELPGPL